MGNRRIRRLPAWAGILLVIVLGMAIGCSSRQPAPQPAPDLPTLLPSEEEARQVREGARQAVPALPEGERGMGPDDLPPTPEVRPGGSAGEEPVVPPREDAAEAVKRLGYRVQIYAASDRELAQQRATEFEQYFDEKVYVIAEGLLYKIRIGNCVSRDEAEALRQKALSMGYEGAFVVSTTVEVH
jgi:hypothetical protein